MVTAEEIIEVINSEILDGSTELQADSKLFSTGLLDSIQLTSLFLTLEQKYGVSIGIFDVSQEKFDTPEQIANWVSSAQ